jgi:hypothetical protein
MYVKNRVAVFDSWNLPVVPTPSISLLASSQDLILVKFGNL